MIILNSLNLDVSDYISLGGFVIFILGLAYALWNKVDKHSTRLDFHDKDISEIKTDMETNLKNVRDESRENVNRLDNKIDDMVKQNNIDHGALQRQLTDLNTAIGELPVKILELIKQ